jgi:hypothetical protein
VTKTLPRFHPLSRLSANRWGASWSSRTGRFTVPTNKNTTIYANTSSLSDAYYYFQNAPSCLSQNCTLQNSGDNQQSIVYDSVSKFFSGVLESFEHAGFVGCYLSTNPASPPDNYDDGEEKGVYSGRPWTLVIVLLASAVGLLILIAVVVWRSPHRTTTIAGTGAKGVEPPVLVPVPDQQQQQQQSPPKE